ncbi:MAG: aromatic aminobenezylarsenical efflux permease ArsG family transporter [Actinobacteria bacterium]|nr:aromatic aminobenezylarsenical efflux permease ArsG family transporter [Actinomycetota bacterium]
MDFIREMARNANVPILAAFFLGIMTAVSPCPLATNIAALSYVSRRLTHRKDTIYASLLYVAGRIVAYTLVGALLIYAGLGSSAVSRFLQKYSEWFLGPLLIIFGLIMLDVIKISIFKGRITARLQEKVGGRGMFGSFLMGFIFALAFCPYSAVLFFGILMPMAVETTAGVGLPPIYGLGTGLPVVIFAVALTVGVSEMGKHIERVQKVEKCLRKVAGVVFIGVGVYYTVLLVKSFF